MTVSAAAKKSRLDALKATRDALATQIDAGGGTVAQCVAQLRAVLVEIEEIELPAKPKKTTGLDEFTQRLRERGARAAG